MSGRRKSRPAPLVLFVCRGPVGTENIGPVFRTFHAVRATLLKPSLLCLAAIAALSPLWGKETWVSVRSEHFTVLTPARPEVARTWALELERFRVMLQEVVNVPESRVRPVTVVLFPSDRAMRPFKPLEKGKPQDVAGLFVNFCDSHAIELSLEADAAEIRRVIFHEAVHWYSSAGDLPLPLWLEEGVAEVYSTFAVAPDGTCSFGNVIQAHLRLLAGDSRWSMQQLATTGHGSLEYNEGDRASRFYAESWLAVHYLLFGRDTPGRASVTRYLEAQARAVSLEAAFQQAFGVGYDGFKGRLDAYLNGGHYLIYHYRMEAGVIEKRLVSRPATPAEVELALGTLLVGAQRQDEAGTEARLQRAAALAPENPVAWQVLGEKAMMDQRLDDAERYFAKAVDAGSGSYYAHYSLGYCRTRSISAAPDLLDSSAALEAVRDFRKAMELNPRFVPAYEGLAGLMFALDAYEPADRKRLEQGERLAPDSGMIDVGLAACDLREGQRERGRHRLGLALENPRVAPEARTLAAEILQGDEWNELMQRLDTLFDRQRYAEVVALIDSVHDRFTETRFRDTLRLNRRRAADFGRIHEAVALANSGNRPAAEKLLQEVVDSAAEAGAKREAQRLLGELTRSGATGHL